MAKNKNDVTVVTKEVAWSDGRPTKYQVMAEFPVGTDRTIRIVGDPKNSKEAAYTSFYDEYALWKIFMVGIDEQITGNNGTV